MPTYEYECDKCGRFDHWQSITSSPLAECPKCGGHVRRLISGSVGIVFKGSGFYCTDNRKKDSGNERSPAKSDSGSDKK